MDSVREMSRFIERMPEMDRQELVARWSLEFGSPPHPRLRIELMRPVLAYRIQENASGLGKQRIPSLVRAVSHAKTWYEWVAKGEIRTMRELAKRVNMERRYAARILNLAALSPQITEAVLAGDHLPSLTIVQLTNQVELDWAKQSLPV